ncbi:MAG: substrate-binding domain-containing protein [Burkholderiales bacterium]
MTNNSMRAVMHELVPQFERNKGYKVSISYDRGEVILGRITRGETADLVILNVPVIGELSRQGKVVVNTRRELSRYGIGMAVQQGAPVPDISSVGAFKRVLLEAKSIAHTSSARSGIYFSDLVERLGIAAQVKFKAKTQPGGLVGELVATGEAEIAIQPVPDLMVVPGINVVALPPELQTTTTLVAGICAGAAQPDVCRALIEFLSTPAAACVLRAAGHEPV